MLCHSFVRPHWVAFLCAGPWNGAAGGMCGGWQCGGSSYLPGSNGFVYTNPGLYNTPALIYPGGATPRLACTLRLQAVAQIRPQAHVDSSSAQLQSSSGEPDNCRTHGLVKCAGGGEYVAYPAYPPMLDRYGRAPPLLHCQKSNFGFVVLLTAGIHELLAPQSLLAC